MPAEWEPHRATWLVWPHTLADWPGRFAPIPWVYAEIIRKLAEGETVRTLVASARHEAQARRTLRLVGARLDNVEFIRWPTDRGWSRDMGPLFVRRGRGLAIPRFRFTGWAKYPNFKKDRLVPERAARRMRLPFVNVVHAGREVVLEGGAIDVNGRGSLLTTEECLLDAKLQVRNPGFSRADYESVFRDPLGATNTIWLGKGIAGDDTHGHVDDLARFVDAKTIVACREKNPRDANHRVLEDNWERLQAARLEDGTKPERVALPMPAPLIFAGRRLPASYANFYIANAAVLVPTFNDPADSRALGILRELFRGRPVVGIHAVELVWGLGTLHCLTQQEPDAGGRRGRPSMHLTRSAMARRRGPRR